MKRHTEDCETAKHAVAIHRMTATERAVFVRRLAAATLRWALEDLQRDGSDDDLPVPCALWNDDCGSKEPVAVADTKLTHISARRQR